MSRYTDCSSLDSWMLLGLVFAAFIGFALWRGRARHDKGSGPE